MQTKSLSIRSSSLAFVAALALISVSVAVLSGIAVADGPALASDTLKKFVGEKDEHYTFEIKERGKIGNCQYLRLHMVSQRWKDVDWKHAVWIIVPEEIIPGSGSQTAAAASDSALLLIAGGSWPAEWGDKGPDKVKPRGEFQILASIASATKSPAVLITQVPFQPMLGDLHEDALIAETFKRYIAGQGSDWPLLLPMVRSAVRAMDTCQSVMQSEWKLTIKRFTVTGASKRGWTTWLTSAVDPRVDALAPMVIDMLNMPVQMQHQLDTWGSYSEEIADYTTLNLPKYLSTPAGEELVRIVDPFRYRNALVQPKVLIFGTNDRYWPLDACNKYWSDLQNEKYLLYVPNQGHGIQDMPRIIGTMTALQRSRVGAIELPKLDWKLERNDGKVQLKMSSNQKPAEVNFWMARSATRDFRNAEWTSKSLSISDSGTCELEHSIPGQGFHAFFGEWTIDYDQYPAFFSTNILIAAPE